MGGAPASSSASGTVSTSGVGGAASSSQATSTSASAAASSSSGGCTVGTLGDTHNCGVCGHDCLGGNCAGGVCQPNVILADPLEPKLTGFTLAKDASNTATGIFWLVAGNAVTNGSVMSLSLSSPTVHTPVVGNQCGPIAIAANATDVYWLNSGTCTVDAGNNGGEVGHANLAGTNVQILYKLLEAPISMVATSGGFAWITTGDGNINFVPQATGVVTSYLTPNPPVALAADGSSIYWTQDDFGVGSMRWSGANPTILTKVTQTIGAIAAPSGGDGPYWLSTGAVMQLVGTKGQTIVSSQGAPKGITSDASGVYWTDATAGTIMKAPPDGSIVATVIGGQTSPDEILTDEVSIFWLSHTTSGDTISRLAR